MPGKNQKPELVAHKEITAPEWQVGDWWQWSDGYALRVVRKDAEGTIFARSDLPEQKADEKHPWPAWHKRQGLFIVESGAERSHHRLVYRSADPMRLFPLKPGNSVTFLREYTANNALRVHRTSWTVEGWESIETPAGKFDCLKLMMRTRSTLSDWVGFERWWYSPAVRHYVRLEYKYGHAPASSRVLTGYHLESLNGG